MPPPSALSIKTSSVLRLIKEEASYHKEATQAQAKLEKLEAGENPDEYEVRQQKRVLEETLVMPVTVRARLAATLEQLKLDLEKPGPAETQATKDKAQKAIEDGKKILAEHPNEIHNE